MFGSYKSKKKEKVILRSFKFELNETLLKIYYAFRNREMKQLNATFSY